MNFLPKENKITIKKKYLMRLFIIVGLLTFFIILISEVLFLSSNSFLKEQKGNLEREVIFSEQKLIKSKEKDIASIVEKFNEKISIFESQQENTKEKSVIVKNILSKKPNKIAINEFLFEKDKILIQGFSDRRNNILDFVNLLKQEKSFKKVELPISNLLKEKDIEFNINIEL